MWFMMKKWFSYRANQILSNLVTFLRKCMVYVISAGPMPNHIAFIMDGNRRFARKWNLGEVAGHRFGLVALMSIIKYCHELGLKYITFYAFSIDNFKRRSHEVQTLMDLIQEVLEGFAKEESMAYRYGVRIYFIGNLKLLSEPVRLAAERAMLSTAKNSRIILTVCVAYSSTDEIAHAVQESCEEKMDEINKLEENIQDEIKLEENEFIKLTDIEKHMQMVVAPDPDILIRTSGETRLSNFLLWQTAYTYLYSPSAYWPEIGFRHLLWAILNFQRNKLYLDKRRKQL